MKRFALLATSLALFGCQVTVRTPDGQTTSVKPMVQDGAAPQANQPGAASALASGVYSYQAQSRHKDGKGKLQNEVAKFSYSVADIGGGRALVKFKGDASAADPGGFGGVLSGAVETSGVATFSNGVWVLSGKSEDGECESRFVVEGTAIKHLGGRCKDAGNLGEMAWPRENAVLRLARPLRDSERAELKRSTGVTQSTMTGSTPARGDGVAFAGLIGKTFPAMQLPYQAFGFDAYDAKLDPISMNEMREGKVTVYPVRKGNARYVVVAAAAGNQSQRVVDVRQAAPNTGKLRFVASSPETGDLITDCTINGKQVAQVFGFAQAGKKRTYAGQVTAAGESAWLVQPGGTHIVALRPGDKLACTDVIFGG